MQKTMTQIANETMLIYMRDPSKISINMKEGACKYYSKETGNTCAVGMHLKQPELYSNCEGIATKLLNTYGDKIFKEEYQGHDPLFWLLLQNCHDTYGFYSKWIISEFELLKSKFNIEWCEEIKQILSQ